MDDAKIFRRRKQKTDIFPKDRSLGCNTISRGDVSRSPSSHDRFLLRIDESNWLKRTDRRNSYKSKDATLERNAGKIKILFLGIDFLEKTIWT
jgi:hypothetical protein